MARIHSDQLIGLLVVTERGQQLGTVYSFEVDTNTHAIVRYTVKPSGIVAILGHNNFLINVSQVVGITEKQMTVRDSAVPIVEKKRKRLALGEDAVPSLPRMRE